MNNFNLKSVAASDKPVAIGSVYCPKIVNKLTINVPLVERMLGRKINWELTDWTLEERAGYPSRSNAP